MGHSGLRQSLLECPLSQLERMQSLPSPNSSLTGTREPSERVVGAVDSSGLKEQVKENGCEK